MANLVYCIVKRFKSWVYSWWFLKHCECLLHFIQPPLTLSLINKACAADICVCVCVRHFWQTCVCVCVIQLAYCAEPPPVSVSWPIKCLLASPPASPRTTCEANWKTRLATLSRSVCVCPLSSIFCCLLYPFFLFPLCSQPFPNCRLIVWHFCSTFSSTFTFISLYTHTDTHGTCFSAAA